MFSSRSIMFALLSFLAGANACIQCPRILNYEGTLMKLLSTVPKGRVTYCNYSPPVNCQYYTNNGRMSGGPNFCPGTAIVKKNC
ncbi:uncharacterized protein EDB91DRAFT_1147101 [Suillus paluster]|uniref:uncharacterized protein n=1 Tax=Suillus paluster TaxID=48578 RepID=UPI001B86635A|nr:uncharacterized protein EDB91DRAFT_1147101 [Suillus paluster]KAG1734256.1 hypothetical protein EDB91DRAFT_1147101 [Suillus paluster]